MKSLKNFVVAASVIVSLVGTAYGQSFYLNNPPRITRLSSLVP